jgi:7-cyano-7-deazaguanine synthase
MNTPSSVPSQSQSAVVLLSGGLDSTTTLALAARDGYALHALTFRYGQSHVHEVDAARRIAARYHVLRHEIIDIDLGTFGGSALTAGIAIPKDRDLETQRDIPVTYVPARNTIFLSYALAFAEVTGSSDIFIGVNHQDYSGYPDCRPEYIAAFERLANLATRAGVEGTTTVRIRAPLLALTKREIIAFGVSLGVDYGLTTSCYDPDPTGAACGRCDACQLRLKGFAEFGRRDPAPYQHAGLTPP